MHWIIVNAEGLFWSNSEGWTNSDDFEVFTQDERDDFNLPIGGAWAVLTTV